MGVQLLGHEFVQHLLREQRLLVAKGLPDEDQGSDGLPPGVKPEGIQGVQRLLGGLVQGQVQQKAAVPLPAAVVDEHVGVVVFVQPVEALVQCKVGAEFGQPGRAVLTAAGRFPAGRAETRSRPARRPAGRWKQQRSWKTSGIVFLIVTQPARFCAIIFLIL